MRNLANLINKVLKIFGWLWRAIGTYYHKNMWHKFLLVIISVVIVVIASLIGVGEWYIHSQDGKPLVLGATFVPDYAESFGLDPIETMTALENIGVKRFRLVSYWNDIEPEQGKFDFSMLDQEFNSAENAHAKITLSIGLRQPRWPECHAPDWVNTSLPETNWLPELEQFMTKVVNRYKSSPALVSYELENEYFNNFGECHDYGKGRLISEFDLVKKLDPNHPIIMSRSNNFPSIVTGNPMPDEVGFSIYHRVANANNFLGQKYFTYPQPPLYYSVLAGLQKIFTGRDSFVHELQAEPWPTNGQAIESTSLSEQNETMNTKILKSNVSFAEATGMRTIDLFGASYWYYRKVKLHDPSLWNEAKAIFSESDKS